MMGRMLLVPLVLLLSSTEGAGEYTRLRKMELRDSVKEMFHHAWSGYVEHAFPADELRPLTCSKNDNFGGYALTAIDSLSTLVMMGELEEFERMVAWLEENINFGRLNRKVSVFETNIRVMGGLLSGHVAATNFLPPEKYHGRLLDLARQLGEKLLPAFDTPTGIPYNEVNLLHGVDHKMGHATCPAAAGTLLLEFGLLGVLTEECKFIEAAYRAIEGVWKLRSPHNLVGTILDIFNGNWSHPDADIGASHDSFFEYMLKTYVIFNDKKWLDIFKIAVFSAQKHLQTSGNWYTKVNHHSLQKYEQSVNSLQAFWPGLLVGYGDIEAAVLAFRPFEILFDRYYMLPEDVKLHSGTMGGAGYPLRPEMVESAWLLYRATGDAHYQRFGERLLRRLNVTARTRCGFAAVKDVTTKQLEDKMDSYLLSETFKYLLLLFDPDPNYFFDLNSPNFVLTTEAHPLPVQASIALRYHQCFPFADKSDLHYTKRSKAFFDDSYRHHDEAAYEKPCLREWEQRDICPKPPHYMRIAGLMREKGRCMLMDYAQAAPAQPTHEQTKDQQASADAKKAAGATKSVQFEISNGDDSESKMFELLVPAHMEVLVEQFTGGVVLRGLEHDWLRGKASVLTLHNGDRESASYQRDFARSALLCVLGHASRWVETAAHKRGTELGATYRQSSSERLTAIQQSTNAKRACHSAVSEAPAVVQSLETRLKDTFFRGHLPNEHMLFFRRRLSTVARHALCTSAVTSAAFASGQGVTRVPSHIEKVLLQEALRFDVVDPANDLVPADEERLLYEGTWPSEADIKQGAGCPHQTPHMQFLGGGATFGREPEDMSEKVEPATLVRAPQKNILGCRPYTASEAAGMAGAVVVLDRGDCTFHHKALLVQQAGGSGMVVLSDHNTRPEEMTDYPGDQQVFIPMMLLAKKDGVTLAQMMSEMQHLTATITKGSHSTGPAEFRFSGIVAAPSPVGITLWRATRPVPGFVEPSAMTAALTSSCYLHTSKMRGAEDISVEVDNAALLLPREGSTVLLVGFTAAGADLQRTYDTASDWYFSHPGTVAESDDVVHPNAVAWDIVGFGGASGAMEYINKRRQAETSATVVFTVGTVVRLYHQPVAWEGSYAVIRWLSVPATHVQQSVFRDMDAVQEEWQEHPDYLSREILRLDAALDVPAARDQKELFSWVDLSQWTTKAAAEAFAGSYHKLGARHVLLKVASLPAHPHSEHAMPQHPLSHRCSASWDCTP